MHRFLSCGVSHLFGLAIMPLVFLSGCGEKALPTAHVTPVSGTVTYKGAALEGATVVFQPDGSGSPAVGVTDAAGHFKLTTYKEGDGAVPGKHVVTVTKNASKAATGEDTSMEAAAARKPEKVAAPQPLIPAIYANPARSGLEQTVKDGETNDFKIELKE